MKSLWIMLKIEFKLAIREFSGILFGIILPAGIITLLGILFGDKLASGNDGYTMLQQSFAAVITIGICATGLMGIPITISSYREKKVLKRFKVTPTSPVLLLIAQFLSNFILAVISSVLVFVIAYLFFDYKMIGSLWIFIIIYLLVVLSIYSIGMLIASISNSVKTSNLLCSLVYFPMFFLSGATIPYEIMPKGLQKFADIMPLTQSIKILKGVSLGSEINGYLLQIIILLVTTIVCIILSIKFFRYEY
ncbi:MAG: ABC transporter permease [Firmicutes bacterium]|nr:ABC transporter permease [Bacillota bacterium]